jgi:hypothetical protein
VSLAPKAIPTKFSSVTFRSRLEARWAVAFDVLKIDWAYEREGYQLRGGWYIPDFWLTTVRMWAEVKPEALNEVETRKATDLALESGKPVLLLIGQPANQPYEAIERVSEGVAGRRSYLLTNHKGYPQREHRFYCEPGACDWFEDTDRAVEAALSAKFDLAETVHPAMNELINIYAPRVRNASNPWAEFEKYKVVLVSACGNPVERDFVILTFANACGL